MSSALPPGKHTQRLIGKRGHLIHKLSATDINGRSAYYFLLVDVEKENAFIERVRNPQGDILELEDYGTVIASCFGEHPNAETKKFLKTTYDLEV
ncbi:MAG: hypothetical protein MK052_02095 [Alphaproteobacteria bacterium]|nr:hypothetical protein [Alphaproteobacteria bacterium]